MNIHFKLNIVINFHKFFNFSVGFVKEQKNKISCFLSHGLQDHCFSNTLLNIQASRYTVIEVVVCSFLFLFGNNPAMN